MSHFTVLVTGDDVEAALAPFDENRVMPRYMARTKTQIIADGRKAIAKYRDGLYARYLADPAAYLAGCSNESHIRYLQEGFPAKLEWTDQQVYEDETRWCDDLDDEGNEWSESNPQGYWDYWRIGGRWAGTLKLLAGRVGHMEPLSWEWSFNGPPEDAPDTKTQADVALRRDIDVDESGPTYAIVHNGEWIARGRMGWFGMSSDSIPEEEWPDRWREFVRALPEDTRLTVVDCHV